MTSTAAVLLLLAAATCTAQNRPLFNGRDLSEFIVDTPGIWEVRPGGVIAGKHGGQKWNDFLRTRKQYRDFTLSVEFRLKDGVGNSGVQFRSAPVEGSHEVSGYQADIGQQYWGCLYDELRRNRVLACPPADRLASLDKAGWNRYEITAQGPKITLRLNSVTTVEYIEQEPGIAMTGFIALQVHSGPGIEVEFRNLRIREL